MADAWGGVSASFGMSVPTVYGPMLVNRFDINQTNSLIKTARAIDHEEIAILARLQQLFPEGRVFVDVGANFGTYTLGLARGVGPAGKVYSFEAQRILFYMLAGTVAMNGLTNVYCHNYAVGKERSKLEIPQFDYNRPLNFGSIEFGGQQREKLDQERQHSAAQLEYVEMVTLDSFDFPRVDIMKIDVEGMEADVLQGATETLKRCRPILYVEHTKSDPMLLTKIIEGFDYQIHPINHMNLLCVPREISHQVTVTY